MSDGTQPSPLTVFLSVHADETDPRALLGLPEGNSDRQAVLNALRSRLAQVAAHPEAGTPAASEVRILLHAAAARLLMPLSNVPTPRLPVAIAPVDAVTADLDTASRAEFERGAMLILGQHGGLNTEAMNALRMLALSHGVPPDRVVPEVMAMLADTGVSAPDVPSVAAAPHANRVRKHSGVRAASVISPPGPGVPEEEFVAPRVLTEQVDPGYIFIRRMFIGAGVFVAVLVVGAVGLYFMTRGPTATTGGQNALATPNASSTLPTERRTDATPAGGGELSPGEKPPAPVPAESIDALVQGVRDAAVQLAPAPDAAMAGFESRIAALSDRWTEATPAQSAAMVDASMEFVYRASGSADKAQRAVSALVVNVDLLSPRAAWTGPDVRRSCFSAGMLARLLRERDLASSILTELHRRGRPVFGDTASQDGSFHAGVTAAVGRLPGLLLGDSAQGPVRAEPGAWEAYAQCVTAAMQKDSTLRQQVLLGALERVVLSPKDPHEDAAILAAEQWLTRGLGFGTGSPARERLVQWLSRGDVSNSDLHTITAAIVEAGQNREIDITMVLSLAATDLDRADLKSRFEGAWGVAGTVAPREMARKWAERASLELGNPSQGAGALEHLVQATRYATLNAGAMRLQDGDASIVDALVQNLDIGVKFVPRQDNTWSVLTGSSESSWAARYLAAGQDIPRRREILGQVGADPTPVDAAILVQEATRGAPAQVRADARRVLAKFTSHPNIVAALLDFASFIPPTRENSAIVESILNERMPAPRSPSWRVVVRRSLVRRMLELVSSDESGFVDLSADHLRRQYDDSLSSWTGPTGGKRSAPVAEPNVSASAAAVRDRLTIDAKKIVVAPAGVAGVPEILSRLQERRQRSEGDIQVFVAEQAACAELLALLTASERPGRADDIAAVMDEWGQSRRGAGHVFLQVDAGERALCRLWIIRLGGEP